MTSEHFLRDEVVRVGKSLFERSYVHGTAGNISVRLPNDEGFLITPTDACLGFLDAETLSHVGIDGVQRSGDRASKTLALHRAIYDTDSEAQCIIHTHSTYCVLLSLNAESEELLPPITAYFVMKVGHVPRISYARYVRPGAPEQASAARETIARYANNEKPIRAIMFDRLGPNVWHQSPAQAMAVVEELEETAKLVHRIGPNASSLSLNDIARLREAFGVNW